MSYINKKTEKYQFLKSLASIHIYTYTLLKEYNFEYSASYIHGNKNYKIKCTSTLIH